MVDSRPLRGGAQEVDGAVGRAAVRDDHLQLAYEVLGRDVADHGLDVRGLVQHRGDDRDALDPALRPAPVANDLRRHSDPGVRNQPIAMPIP